MSGTEVGDGWEMVVTTDNQPIFPPTDHEDLISHSSSSVDRVEDRGEDLQADADDYDAVGRCLRDRFEVIRDGFRRLGWRIRGYASSVVVSASGLLIAALFVSLLYRKFRRLRLREHRNQSLAILVRDRDEKINRLLLQVAHANKLLIARQSVPIPRRKVPVPVIRVRTG